MTCPNCDGTEFYIDQSMMHTCAKCNQHSYRAVGPEEWDQAMKHPKTYAQD